MTFSWPGLLVSLAVLLPNLLLLVLPPRPAPGPESRTPLPLTVLERAGQAGCLVAPALTGSSPQVDGWLVALAIAVLGYYGLWVRFLAGGRQLRDLYRPLGPLPVPMAVFPVLAFVAAAGWLHSWWIAAAAAVLAAGHVPAAWLIHRRIEQAAQR